MLTKKLVLEGLDCANCAAKIEDEVNHLDGVRANVDLMNQSMTLELASESLFRQLLPTVERIVYKHEPDVRVLEPDDKAPESEQTLNTGMLREHLPMIARLAVGGLVFAAAMLFTFAPWLELSLFLLSYLIVGGPVLRRAAKGIVQGQVFSEYFLMSIATIGAFAIGEYPEGVAVMLFYLVGELFQEIAVGRSRRSITSLMNIRPDSANLLADGEIREVRPEEVQIGDRIVVRPGERIPLDGYVVKGSSLADTSALTGESMPRDLSPGSEALSGFVNQSGLLTIEVSKPFAESTVSRILDLVQNASANKAPTEQLITRFARYYTPAVVFAALALAIIPPLVLPGAVFADWAYRALVFLVISCPCALVVSIPLSFFGGIGGASRRGILVKGSNYLEALNDVDTIVFDKTGTLTQGVFEVTEVVPAGGFTAESLLEAAAYAESYSTHPIAASILEAYGEVPDASLIESNQEIAGQGLKVVADGHEILAGNAALMRDRRIPFAALDAVGTTVHVAVDGEYAGHILIADTVKDDAVRAVDDLKQLGIRKTVMLTGDSRAVGEQIGQLAGLDEVHAELLPADKVERLEALEGESYRDSGKHRIAAVGDGINDAPLLARSDVGIAMGGLGSDAAIEAADIVIMTDEPSKIATAIRIARRTRIIAYQNIFLALVIKSFFLLLGALGMATMWEAVFADVGVTVLAVLNAMRAMRTKGL